MRRIRKKGGFSLVETVIALALVVIVTASALSIVMYSTTARVKAENKSEALNFAQNVVECFKAADSETEFEENLKFITEEKNLITDAGEYKYNSNRFNAQIKNLKFDYVGKTATVTVRVEYGDKNDDALEKTYTKYIDSVD